jgi:hypothetical protein
MRKAHGKSVGFGDFADLLLNFRNSAFPRFSVERRELFESLLDVEAEFQLRQHVFTVSDFHFSLSFLEGLEKTKESLRPDFNVIDLLNAAM